MHQILCTLTMGSLPSLTKPQIVVTTLFIFPESTQPNNNYWLPNTHLRPYASPLETPPTFPNRPQALATFTTHYTLLGSAYVSPIPLTRGLTSPQTLARPTNASAPCVHQIMLGAPILPTHVTY